MPPAAPSDYRALARRRLPRFLFDYLDGGAQDEATLARNTADLARITIRQRVLRDVSMVDTATTLFGAPAALPLLLAPVGMAGLYARRGETQAARAAATSGVPFALSTMSICDPGEVRRATTGSLWFQLYVTRHRGVTAKLIDRAEAEGAAALVVTVDFAVPGLRYRDRRSGLAAADRPTLGQCARGSGRARHARPARLLPGRV